MQKFSKTNWTEWGITYEEIENLYGDKTYRLFDVNQEQKAYIRNLEEEGISVIDD